jgi:hypothetical protein
MFFRDGSSVRSLSMDTLSQFERKTANGLIWP